ncbi:putative indole-3-pyruvate monooxygenase YUCCA1 [Pseudocercospora fuligena]|uniref:Putative indole-3-pyruvate monooxygenase YUCCA1 n=1 Tax=Pseudocercospora fuligena TaxID=685502 RepID=A0A8H6VJ40_9PEZI|nr:putative indole-3-pyruvate monooxygenase YUCCA1 [Pseudocercospora fuligena]
MSASTNVGPERCEPGSVNIRKAVYPPSPNYTPSQAQVDQIAENIIRDLNDAIVKNDRQKLAGLFLEDSYWRDHLAITWDLRTIKGRNNITSFYFEHPHLKEVTIDRGSEIQVPHYGFLDGVAEPNGIIFLINFRSSLGSGRGVVRLANKGDDWKIWTIGFTLESLPNRPEPMGANRPQGVQHGDFEGRKSWLQRRSEEQDFRDHEPVVLVIGAGQAGLTISARLRMLGIDTLVIDTNARVGDSWRKRYEQLVLHDPVWYDHLPYLPFPKHWPIFSPKDKIADWFESYAKIMELNIWTSTELLSAKYNDTLSRWTIELQRGHTEHRTLHPRHIVMCTGHSGKSNFPSIPGIRNFQGSLLCHSSNFPGVKPLPTGTQKKALVIGACNSAHDIAHDYFEKGYDVTLIQRSSTSVISSNSVTEIGLKGMYDESPSCPATEDADICSWVGMPSEVLKAQQVRVFRKQNENDRELLEGLEKVGFKLDKGPSDAGTILKYFQRGGGYYLNVGASELIVAGKIKVKQGQDVVEVLEHGLKFADGSVLEADEIVFATGYQNMRSRAREILGDEAAERIGDVWGFDQEGEFRVIYKRSGHSGVWFHGGNLAMCRYFSRLLALQIAAIELGLARRDTTKPWPAASSAAAWSQRMSSSL